MAKLRLYKNQDGVIETLQLNPIKFDDSKSTLANDPYADKVPAHLSGLDFIVVDTDEEIFQGIIQDKILSIDNINKRSIDKLYFNGATSRENLMHDDDWSINLMPQPIIKAKYIKGLQQQIDNELAKEQSDSVELAKKQRELEIAKAKAYPDPGWYPIALANLDARIAKGEVDKPIIRQKLQAKINELSIGTPDMDVGGGKKNATPK